MQVWNENGPIYETMGPNSRIIFDEIKKTTIEKIKERINNLNEKKLNNIIQLLIDKNFKNGFPSYRGYYTFYYNQLKKETIDEYYIYHMNIKRLCRLLKPIIIHRLYKPPSPNKKKLRYGELENNFNNNKKKNNKKEVVELSIDLSDTENFMKNIDELKKLLKGIISK